MTKREEIREGMRTVLSDCLVRDDLLASDIIEFQLRYLHSQGVVIRLPAESPEGCCLARLESLVKETNDKDSD